MIEKLLPLLGKRIDEKEIKAIFTDWNVPFPRTITCSADRPTIKEKVERNCLRLHFDKGGNSRYMKPIPTEWEGGHICLLTSIEITNKRKRDIPFDLRFDMTNEEITEIMGEASSSELMSKTTTWRKSYEEKFEVVLTDTVNTEEVSDRKMYISYAFEPEFYTIEDFIKAGL
jgi:hypothetical protein